MLDAGVAFATILALMAGIQVNQSCGSRWLCETGGRRIQFGPLASAADHR